ncbi:adenosylcobinamide-phosphate synthase [Syntrophobotulus glycolicus DSM 8271]|uniref:Cobalamin biosynthesis protein CobD n=1 Tax=Syntrophobotulus glycolicus (strain DSM 8271 / FlGlyR) TaxID=645991 RepID=F0SZ34_SYNGF|nr:adenosylcobinamide-phosphate synthase CbiB [Syntrophobotulus glycolicus]ADY57152.1 adenosylcobinamide-phosphate synthase [Syntrophobotulus glycolicus DSM 8271]
MMAAASLLTGYLLDLLFGDPQWLPHPVRGMGLLISRGEAFLRRLSCRTPQSQWICGLLLTLLVAAVSFILPDVLLKLARASSPLLGYGLESLMCYQILATKSLKVESMRVYRELIRGDLPAAREKLSRIVSRDTAHLDVSQVSRSTVETIAENTSDGVVAPLLFILIGGAPLGFLYKAINTLDSMIGYKNEKYLYFGKFAAKLDDAANFIPARLAAYFMLLAACLSGYDTKNAWRIYRRDRMKHTSPNSAQTEAVCAGALNIQLAGNNYYFGKLLSKPTIGDNGRPVEAEDILRANRLLYVTSALALTAAIGIHIILLKFL